MKRLLSSIVALAIFALPASAQFASTSIIPLGNFQIGSAGTTVGATQAGLQGMTALSCQVNFAYGSGGTQVNVYIQSSVDQGTTWFDVANFEFTTSSNWEAVNLSGLNSVTTPTALSNKTLTNNTTFNGPLGDRLQAVVVSTGTYGGGTLASVNCAPR